MPAAQIQYWDDVFGKLVQTEEWKRDLESNLLENTYLNSRDSRKYMDAQYVELRAVLTDLGLVK